MDRPIRTRCLWAECLWRIQCTKRAEHHHSSQYAQHSDSPYCPDGAYGADGADCADCAGGGANACTTTYGAAAAFAADPTRGTNSTSPTTRWYGHHHINNADGAGGLFLVAVRTSLQYSGSDARAAAAIFRLYEHGSSRDAGSPAAPNYWCSSCRNAELDARDSGAINGATAAAAA